MVIRIKKLRDETHKSTTPLAQLTPSPYTNHMGALTQDEKDAIRDKAVAQWWKDWFAADYSWDGLTKVPWHGWKVVESQAAYQDYLKTHGLPAGCPNEACQVVPADFDGLPEGTKTRDATLQDYWRDQENALEGQEGGKQYTIAHLPAKFEDGQESWKANPHHKKWDDLRKIVTKRIKCGVRTEVEFDFFSNEKVTGSDGRSNFQGCVLPTLPANANLSDLHDKATIALHITLQQAALLHTQNFQNTTFRSAANFRRAQFSGGDANFNHAKFSGGNANFRNAQFSGGNANFSQAQFSGGNANFNKAQFSGGNANFRNVQFSGGDAHFYNSQFSGGMADFFSAQFSGRTANFMNAQFSGGAANFIYAQFSCGKAEFNHAQFSGGNAYFWQARFKVRFDFMNSIFEKRAHFKNTVFPPASGSENTFHGTEFLGSADFSRNKFKDDFGKPLPSDDLHFPFNAFANANFKDRILLTQRGEKYAQGEFDRAVRSLKDSCEGEDEDRREDRWVALESGCRTLKQEMESISDKNRAQRYFKFELLARQQRPKTGWITKRMTTLYGWAADYGGSIGRPLLALFIAWAVFTLGYLCNAWAVEVETTKPWQMLWGAMDFSATHIFRPLFIWSKNVPEDSWLSAYQSQLSTGGWLTVKLFATLQSFLSITLLFLFGLATKRKFQMG